MCIRDRDVAPRADRAAGRRWRGWLGSSSYGVLAGFTTMVANAGGPVLSMYFLASRSDSTPMRPRETENGVFARLTAKKNHAAVPRNRLIENRLAGFTTMVANAGG